MKKLHVLFMAVLCISVLAGCNKDTEGRKLGVSPAIQTIGNQGGDVNIHVTSIRLDWTLTLPQVEGLSATLTSGTESANVKVTVPANTTGERRKIMVQLSSGPSGALYSIIDQAE